MKTQAMVLVLLIAGNAMAQQQKDERRKPPTGADFVARLDRNNDGKVSKDEFDGPAEHFSHFDANGDGYIAADEAPSGPPPHNRGQRKKGKDQRPPRGEGDGNDRKHSDEKNFIAHFDRDGDGQVSKSEFDGPSEHFKHMDRNGDGFVDQDEAPQGPPPRMGRETRDQ